MSLTVGLTIGFAAAGAAAGGGLKIADEIGGAFLAIPLAFVGAQDSAKSKLPSLATCTLVGSLAGGAFGYAAGEGYEYLSADANADKNSIVQLCYENAPEEQKAVIAQDALGNPVCSYE